VTTEKICGALLVPRPSAAMLNPREQIAYREHRRELLTWLQMFGRGPEHNQGYADATVRMRAYRIDKLYRFVWEREGYYTDRVTPMHADQWIMRLAQDDYLPSYLADCQKAAKTLFKWQSWRTGEPVVWEPLVKYNDRTFAHQPRDYLTRDERRRIAAAAFRYGAAPLVEHMDGDERKEWDRILSQRFGKPLREVTEGDYDRTHSWKIPSVVWTSLDAGFRPIEVGRAQVSWVDLSAGVLRIPKRESTKNEEDWVIGLRDDTTVFLEHWLEERAENELYDGTDALWLTRRGTRYASHSLNYVFGKLCAEAGIDTTNRECTWYSIRRSTATYMAREEDLAAAAAQLRHRSIRTTARYDQAPVDDRKAAIERI
jgi:integrase